MRDASKANKPVWGDLVLALGQAGRDLTRLPAAEGAAGNISVYVSGLMGVKDSLQLRAEFSLPVASPALAGGWVVVTGTGCRLRDLRRDAKMNLCALHIHADGSSATLHTARRLAPTSELNSHLAIHNDQVSGHGFSLHAVVHAQPRYLTYLSHHPAYQARVDLNRRLLRWEPETTLAFPEGMDTIPFEVPGTQAMMRATVQALRDHRIVVWQRHGVVTRSEVGVRAAADLVEYAEAAAHFEYLNLQVGEPSEGMSSTELKKLREAWRLLQS